MNQLRSETLSKLLDLAARLFDETQDFLEQPENQQLWYDRGYSVGVLQTIQSLRDDAIPAPLQTKLKTHCKTVAQHRMLPWGKAYQHGTEKGAGDAAEMLDAEQIA